MNAETIEKFKESIENKNKTCCDELKTKRIPVKLFITEFIIKFEYETFKGNHRKNDKRLIKHVNKQAAKEDFKEWSKNIRTMSNVKILDIVETENIQEIEL